MRRKITSDEEGLSRELTCLIILIIIIGALSIAGAFTHNTYPTPPSAKIGVISIDNTVYSFEYAHQIENALDDDTVKAVVVKVKSPRGYAGACFQTEESLSRLADKKTSSD